MTVLHSEWIDLSTVDLTIRLRNNGVAPRTASYFVINRNDPHIIETICEALVPVAG